MKDPQLSVRPKFIASAAVGIALALVVGYPVGGWLMEPNSGLSPNGGNLAAFHLAKAGVDRALWQMNHEKANLDTLLAGESISGLSGSKIYTDVPGGTYKVEARYDKASRSFEITGTGTDAETGKVRAIQMVLKQQVSEKGMVQIEWKEVDPEA